VLAQNIMALGINGVNIFAIGAAPGLLEQKVRSELNGKSFDEIKAAAEAVKAEQAAQRAVKEKKAAEADAERKAVRKKQIEAEIAELTAEKNKATQDAAALKKFEVQRSRFYYSTTGFTKSPVIELTVKNGLGVAVSRAYFKGILTSPGRSIPWVSDTFNYSIAGGLEPNEVGTWKLSPNMFGTWAKAPENRDDLVLTVELVQVDGANAKTLYDTEFSERKQTRLDALRASLEKDGD